MVVLYPMIFFSLSSKNNCVIKKCYLILYLKIFLAFCSASWPPLSSICFCPLPPSCRRLSILSSWPFQGFLDHQIIRFQSPNSNDMANGNDKIIAWKGPDLKAIWYLKKGKWNSAPLYLNHYRTENSLLGLCSEP